MKKYRIQKRSYVLYNEDNPKKHSHYVIQKKTLFFWFDMHLDDYADSIMSFEDISDASKYMSNLQLVEINQKSR